MIQWSLPYPDLYYPGLYYLGTSIVWTAQIGHVACSLLAIMKFGLTESRSLKVAVYMFGGLFILLIIIITTTWLLGDNRYLQPREVTMNVL